MFTGIIQAIARVKKSEMKNGSLFLTIEKPKKWKIKPGDSIATDGVCLTVKKSIGQVYITELMRETLDRTYFSKIIPKKVNVEQSLTLSNTLDGHLVLGHIDAVGSIIDIKKRGQSKIYTFSFPKKFAKLIASKGSIAVDGISLTVVDVGKDSFMVSFVDYTLSHTTIGEKMIGDCVNLEFDILAKYISRLMYGRSVRRP